jgi:hypothetical protein
MKTKFFKPQKRRLLVAMQLAGMAIAGFTSPAFAQLLDHGPSDATLIWPQWYRANDGVALGMCKSQAPSPNAAAAGGKMCFPLPSDPTAFAGNVGPEIFYNLVDYRQKPGSLNGFNFRYLAGLEASYVPGPNPVHGQETVFARIRIAMNFNDPSFEGDYTVTHPFGVEHFKNLKATTTSTVQGKQAALFATFDVPLGVPNDFNAALGGPIGPFIKWDVVNPGESLNVGGQQFLGDPNYPHTFTGSPFVDANGLPQNYIKVEGPAAADFGNGPGVPLIITEANVLGQVWGAPIASNLVIDQATVARQVSGLNSIDVWATSSPGHKLVLTSAGMPSMEMLEDLTTRGHYHGHIEFSGIEIPAFVTVTDNTSVPIIGTDHQLTDSVEISMASFDTVSGDINIVARSSDEIVKPELVVENIPGIPSATVTGQMKATVCSDPSYASIFAGVSALDQCFHTTLPTNNEPPKFISVRSESGGSHDDLMVMLTGNPQNISPAPLQSDLTLSVNTNGSSVLLLPSNSLIVTQPSTGTVALVNGQYQYTANIATVAGTDSFLFVLQDPITKAVSAQAKANLTLVFTATAPKANNDQFAAQINVASTLNVLANDTPATADPLNALDPASVKIVTKPSRGTAVVNTVTGAITYTPNTAGVVDSLTYTVANKAGNASTATTVQVTNFSARETISFKRNPQFINGKWTIGPSTSWFGPNLTQTAVSCYLTVNNGTPITPVLIGTALVDATGNAQIAGITTPTATASASVQCITSNGGFGNGTVVFK